MKYDYKIRILELRGRKRLLIDLPSEMELISTFLESDVQGEPSFAIESLEKVLTGKSDYEELNGNVCGLEIRREKTKIFNNLAEDGIGNWCEIETDELRDLVNIWVDELKKFRENSSKQA